MPALTALLHTHNDALRLGRALETLYACDQIVIIDHNSNDGTVEIAREYGATVVQAQPDATPASYIQPANHGFIFCLSPNESVSESLASSLFELKLRLKSESNSGQKPATYSVHVREETAHGWIDHSAPQTRIVPHTWSRWIGNLPADDPAAVALEGELLRFTLP
jgi:glycosyltransferase involved in cell wall biosynthesis